MAEDSSTPPRSEPSQTPGRGARRRQDLRQERSRRAALAWWGQPGILLFLAVVVLSLVGWWLLLRAGQKIPVRDATIGGLQLHLEQARWILDQMDHGENFKKPSVMMPDMPVWGNQRVTVELALYNESGETQTFDGAELWLVPEIGQEVPPMGAQVGLARLAPGQALNTAVHFDFDTTQPHGKLRVAWRRDGQVAYLPIPEPAEHYHLRPRDGETSLPPDARMVQPLGDAERGRRLYDGVYGCVACHGDPQIPGTNNVGPHLGGIAAVADARIEGVPGMQYLYESILDPNAFLAPACKNGEPCESPSSMPEYASLMSVEHVADLLNYLMEQRQVAPASQASDAVGQ